MLSILAGQPTESHRAHALIRAQPTSYDRDVSLGKYLQRPNLGAYFFSLLMSHLFLLFHKYLLNSYYVPVTRLSSGYIQCE